MRRSAPFRSFKVGGAEVGCIGLPRMLKSPREFGGELRLWGQMGNESQVLAWVDEIPENGRFVGLPLRTASPLVYFEAREIQVIWNRIA